MSLGVCWNMFIVLVCVVVLLDSVVSVMLLLMIKKCDVGLLCCELIVMLILVDLR